MDDDLATGQDACPLSVPRSSTYGHWVRPRTLNSRHTRHLSHDLKVQGCSSEITVTTACCATRTMAVHTTPVRTKCQLQSTQASPGTNSCRAQIGKDLKNNPLPLRSP